MLQRKFLMFFILICGCAFGASPNFSSKDYSHLLGMAGFDNRLLQMHFTLYEGYVKNANLLLSKLEAMRETDQTGSYEYGALKRRFGWEYDGMRLHELYFENLGGNGEFNKTGPFASALIQQFGSFENWKKDFVATGLMRGIGWAILYVDPIQKKLVNTWINEHDVGHFA